MEREDLKLKKKLITSAVLFTLGVSVILGAVFFKVKHNAITGFDLTDECVGRQIEMVMPESHFPYDGTPYYISYDNLEMDEYSYVRMTVPDDLKTAWDNSFGSSVSFTGIVSRADDEVKQEVYDVVITFYERVAEHLDDFTVDDALRQKTREEVCDYCIEVVSISSLDSIAPRLLAGAAGAFLIIASLIFLISALSRKKITKVLAVTVIVLAVLMGVAAAVLFDKIRSVSSIRREGEGLYSMRYYGDLKYDELIDAQVATGDGFVEWIRRNEFYNIPFSYVAKEHGCSSYTGTSGDGDILFGFNYDQEETDTLVLYIDPSDGYAHYATCALGGLNIGTPGGYASDSLESGVLMLAAPYCVNDGVNEMGLGVTYLQLKVGETHQDTDNPDININLLPGLLLTRCATVDEAVELLGSIDVQTEHGVSCHFFICDTSGRAVVVEWLENEMSVIEADACTNSALTPGEHFGEGHVDERLDTLTGTLDAAGGHMSPEQARDLLDSVSQEDYTEWSCVYNLNGFSFTIYLDEDYATPYTFGQ